MALQPMAPAPAGTEEIDGIEHPDGPLINALCQVAAYVAVCWLADWRGKFDGTAPVVAEL